LNCLFYFLLKPASGAVREGYNILTKEIVIIFEGVNDSPGKIFTEVFTTESGKIQNLKNKSNKGAVMELKKDDL
jgi:hypothetical protein